MTRLGDLLDVGNFLKPLATINLPKSPTFLGNFCKGVKIYHFSSKIIFGQLLQTSGEFFLVTLIGDYNRATVSNFPLSPKPMAFIIKMEFCSRLLVLLYLPAEGVPLTNTAVHRRQNDTNSILTKIPKSFLQRCRSGQ